MPVSAAQASIEVRRSILRTLGDPAAVAALPPGELDFTIRVVRRAKLLGRLAWRLRQAGLLEALPQTAIDALQGALATAEARTRVARWELNRIARALADEATLPLVAMKGCAYLLAGLPNAAGRLFADVDLLVPEASLPRVESRLVARGWRGKPLTPYDDNYYRLWTHELPPMVHVERAVEVDLHHNVLMRTARLKPDAALLLSQARAVPDSRFGVLAPVDMVLHAMVHLLHGGEMDDALRDLVDVDDLLRHYGQHEPGFWQQFWPRTLALDLARPAFYGLHYASRLLATPVPPPVLQAARAAAPPSPVLALMDMLVPLALFPRHPERHSRRTGLARLLLYLRSHWVRMPPLMLMRHLSYKFYLRYLRGMQKPATAAAEK